MTIVEFLRARLDEDEAVAKAAPMGAWHVKKSDQNPDFENYTVASGPLDITIAALFEVKGRPGAGHARTAAEHMARHDPGRVLREVEAKRRIVDQTGWVTVIRYLASVYADHPDYREEWKP